MLPEFERNRTISEFFARPDVIIPETKTVTVDGRLAVAGVYDAPRIDIPILIDWAVDIGLPPTQREDALALIQNTGFPFRLISKDFLNSY